MVTKLHRDCVGSSLVEFTIVFPVLIFIALTTVDLGFMLYDWALANNAAYAGAHRALVSNPVAVGATEIYNGADEGAYFGQSCSPPAPAVGHCPTGVSIVCTGIGGPDPATARVTCETGINNTWPLDAGATNPDNVAFQNIFRVMNFIFPRLRADNVTISYQRNNNLGFNAQGYLPMEVTVSIGAVNPVSTQFYFTGGLLGWFGGAFDAAKRVPAFATTLTSEDMCTEFSPCGY